MSHHHSHTRTSVRSQERKYRHIAWMRKAKRWLKKGLVIVAILLTIVVVLSFFLITKEEDPDEVLLEKSIFDSIIR